MVDHIPVYPKTLKRVPALGLKRLAPQPEAAGTANADWEYRMNPRLPMIPKHVSLSPDDSSD